jgi:hypothetical protein
MSQAITIPRPDHEALVEIEAALDEVERAERRVIEFKQAAVDRVVGLAGLQDRSERLRIVRYLYWTERRVNSNALTAALLLDWSRSGNAGDVDLSKYRRWASKMRQMVGPLGTRECATPDCDERVPVTSRTALEKGTGERYCEQCARWPRRPVPCANWAPAVADEETKRAEYQAARRRAEMQARVDLTQLKERANLGEGELVRLYELMSYLDEDVIRR